MADEKQRAHKYGMIDKDYAISLATCAPENDGPIYMVNLMKYHEVAQYGEGSGPEGAISGREADDRYNPTSILSKIGATMVFLADVVGTHSGGDDWDRIAVVRYATRKSFIDMQSRRDFSEKHEHKAAGMKRTIIVCCRPEDLSLDERGRPQHVDGRFATMVVRRGTERASAFASLPGAVNFAAEGTIIGDGRSWDTVQFIAAASADEARAIAESAGGGPAGEDYAMSLQITLDSVTAS
jgi:hypothetical protein